MYEAPAMQNHISALSIDLDFGNDPKVLCRDPRVSDDAVVISDATKDGDDDWNWYHCATESTTGYNYESDERGRHTLDFCHLIPGDEEKSMFPHVCSCVKTFAWPTITGFK